MKKLVMGCAVVSLIALSPKTEAKLPNLAAPLPALKRMLPPLRHSAHPWHAAFKGEIGVASWYGSEFFGRSTASGELYDPSRLTAAHRRLPFGTVVRVTNLRNLASILLKITDRGPGSRGRVIDVSQAAAKELGFMEAGVARVRIDVVSYPQAGITEAMNTPFPKVN